MSVIFFEVSTGRCYSSGDIEQINGMDYLVVEECGNTKLKIIDRWPVQIEEVTEYRIPGEYNHTPRMLYRKKYLCVHDWYIICDKEGLVIESTHPYVRSDYNVYAS
jgi:hypothetical protein